MWKCKGDAVNTLGKRGKENRTSGKEMRKAMDSVHRQLHLTSLQGRRVQAVARTIADLAGSSTIAARHLAEAIQYVSRFIREEE
jgi:predicted ATPase with chaperone activity